jgi:lipopolysaccharide transport system ATP-binding protein
MSSSDIAIQARNVSKSYRIVHEERATTLGESIVKRVRKPLARTTSETFWALQDINFDIPKGDVVGIIGRNGAGKSTLLKILSRITAPATGEITIRGRVGSLLEVGTGFHPELTGRENIYLNGAILGMSRKETTARFDEIVDFSGVEQFLDTPVKRYSSGMYVRLAFSVAAHLDPEVMIVDEVLAVGDAEFQKKCLSKMQDVADGGRTVLFVSHNIHSITTLCKSAILLDKGRLVAADAVDPIVERYANMVETEVIDLSDHRRRAGTGDIRFVEATPAKSLFEVTEDKTFRIRLDRMKPGSGQFRIMAGVTADRSGRVCFIDSQFEQLDFNPEKSAEIDLTLKNLWLKPGKYSLDLYAKYGDNLMDHANPACRFEVNTEMPYKQTSIDPAQLFGSVICPFEFNVLKSS